MFEQLYKRKKNVQESKNSNGEVTFKSNVLHYYVFP